MPDLTITLTDPEYTQLEVFARRRGLTIADAHRLIVNRAIRRTPADRSNSGYRQKVTGRLARIAALVDHIKRHGAPGGQADKQALADQFGVSLRTVYMDVEVALATIEREKQLGALQPYDVAPPRPKRKAGRKPTLPRYRRPIPV